AVHFAHHLPWLAWQPTDRAEYLPGLAARIAQEGPPNLRAALELDVTQPTWPVTDAGAVLTGNTLHTLSWPEIVALVAGIGRVLAAHGALAIYGPFRYRGHFTTE